MPLLTRLCSEAHASRALLFPVISVVTGRKRWPRHTLSFQGSILFPKSWALLPSLQDTRQGLRTHMVDSQGHMAQGWHICMESARACARPLSSCSLNWCLPPHLNTTQDGANNGGTVGWGPGRPTGCMARLPHLKILPGCLSPAMEGTVLVVGGTALVSIEE